MLEPLRVEHAREMASVLEEAEDSLRARYVRQVAGRERGWLNWVVRCDGVAVGYVQATLAGDGAELAWVVGSPWRGRGIASEGTAAVMEWLASTRAVTRFFAHIDPANAASAGVARRVGLVSTEMVRADGEVRWEG
jgi:RimJ/RimL family protein N-acetyltransferase